MTCVAATIASAYKTCGAANDKPAPGPAPAPIPAPTPALVVAPVVLLMVTAEAGVAEAVAEVVVSDPMAVEGVGAIVDMEEVFEPGRTSSACCNAANRCSRCCDQASFHAASPAPAPAPANEVAEADESPLVPVGNAALERVDAAAAADAWLPLPLCVVVLFAAAWCTFDVDVEAGPGPYRVDDVRVTFVTLVLFALAGRTAAAAAPAA